MVQILWEICAKWRRNPTSRNDSSAPPRLEITLKSSWSRHLGIRDMPQKNFHAPAELCSEREKNHAVKSAGLYSLEKIVAL